MKLQNLVKEIEQKKLVLPDFQRKFVWDKDDMCGLFASVLCQMPIGSILTLESADAEFSCKKFGAKPRECKDDIAAGKSLEYLIDGQQRLTSLFAGYTTFYYSAFKEDPKKIAANMLLDMYFIKIPAKMNDDGRDLFNAKTLSFDGNWRNEGTSYFSSEEVKRMIESKKVSQIIDGRKNNLLDLDSDADLDAVCTYCCNKEDDCYRIPLQFVLHTTGKVFQAYNKILNAIAALMSDGSEKDEPKKIEWVTNVRSYLCKCLEELQLDRIRVENSDKIRAIDIYSNLNKGGVALNVFDLIMAKVGKKSKNNFYDTLVGYIRKEYKYPKKLLDDSILQVKIPDDYSYHATKLAEVLNGNDDISSEYINNFLNILSLYTAKKDGIPFNVDLIKEKTILELDPKKIVENSEKICEAMDRALFFFQTRCGVKKLSDINYKAQFTVVAYFFTDDSLYKDIRVHDIFEYWYWMSLFAYMYPSNQNVKILNEIEYFTEYFEKFDADVIYKHFDAYNEQLLNVVHYSDKATLTMSKIKDTQIAPAAVMTKYLCQFYLAKGYDDFFEDKSINFMYENPLEVHHLMPLGSDPTLGFGKSTKQNRNDKLNPFNSPLNMLYISKSANLKISDMDYNLYVQNTSIGTVLSTVGCVSGLKLSLDEFLSVRFTQFGAALRNRLKALKAQIDTKSKKKAKKS